MDIASARRSFIQIEQFPIFIQITEFQRVFLVITAILTVHTHSHTMFCTSIPWTLWFLRCRRENGDKQHRYWYRLSSLLCIGIVNGSSPAVDFPYCGCTYGFSSCMCVCVCDYTHSTDRQKHCTHCSAVYCCCCCCWWWCCCCCHNHISCADMLYFITFFLSCFHSFHSFRSFRSDELFLRSFFLTSFYLLLAFFDTHIHHRAYCASSFTASLPLLLPRGNLLMGLDSKWGIFAKSQIKFVHFCLMMLKPNTPAEKDVSPVDNA